MNQSILALTCLIAGFLITYYLPDNQVIRKNLIIHTPHGIDNARHVLFQRLLGLFFYGFIPAFVITATGSDPAAYGIVLKEPVFVLWTGTAMGAVMVLLSYLNHRTPLNLEMYPQIRNSSWTAALLVTSALSWLAYLFAYEFLFRGYLLFAMREEMGIWNAIAVNTAVYSLVHTPKGWKEVVGSLPLGILLCVVCLRAGSIWPAFIAHGCLALSNEWLSLTAHPSMRLVRKRGEGN